MHTEIVNTILGIYISTIEKYLSHVKDKNDALQKKADDSSHSVRFQQSILLLSLTILPALK